MVVDTELLLTFKMTEMVDVDMRVTVTALHSNVAHTLVFEWMLFCLYYCPHVHDTGSYSQEPINCNDESDVIGRKPNRGQYNHHGDQACLRDASSSNTGCSCCNTWLKRNTHTQMKQCYCWDFVICIFLTDKSW